VETSQKSPIEQGDLTVVFWFDTVQDASWEPISVVEKEKPVLVKSVGWFLNQDEDCVRILTSISAVLSAKPEVGSIIIPQKTIKHIEKVREDELECEL